MFYLTYSKKVKSFLISKRRLETSQMFPFIKIYVLNSKNNFFIDHVKYLGLRECSRKIKGGIF